jgi:hypothetical protein
MNGTLKLKYSIRFLESESRWVICPVRYGHFGIAPMTLRRAKEEVKKLNQKVEHETGVDYI